MKKVVILDIVLAVVLAALLVFGVFYLDIPGRLAAQEPTQPEPTQPVTDEKGACRPIRSNPALQNADTL